MNKIWIGLVIATALTLVLAPSSTPALPEPGHRRILAAVFR
jgi:hypothetical protein